MSYDPVLLFNWRNYFQSFHWMDCCSQYAQLLGSFAGPFVRVDGRVQTDLAIQGYRTLQLAIIYLLSIHIHTYSYKQKSSYIYICIYRYKIHYVTHICEYIYEKEYINFT